VLAILGASGHGRVVADAALESDWSEVAFFDDAWPEKTACGEWRVIGDSAALTAAFLSYQGVIVGIGNCLYRASKHSALRELGAPLTSIVHPRAHVSRRAELGAGSVLMAQAVVNIGARIGEACIINTGATVDHDCELGFAVHVAPGAHLSGNVTVGDRAWIGVGACIRQGIRIGADATVGAGAVVIDDVLEAAVVFGVPARPSSRGPATQD